MKQKKIIIPIVLICIVFVAIVSAFIYKIIDKNNTNKPFENTDTISLYYDYNPKGNLPGNKDVIRIGKRNNTAFLEHIGNSSGENYSCEFALSKYDELLQLVLKNKLIVYEPKSDNVGKITDEVEPFVICLNRNFSQDYFVPSNIEEIKDLIEEMDRAAKEEYNQKSNKGISVKGQEINNSINNTANYNYYYNDNQSQGYLDSKSENNSESKTGVGGIPGTDNNNSDSTYIIDDNGVSRSTTIDVK